MIETNSVMESGSIFQLAMCAAVKAGIRHFAIRQSPDHLEVWDLEKLWTRNDSCFLEKVLVESIDVDDPGVWFNAGECPSPHEILSHMKRILAADMSVPIIKHSDGHILDGMHRVAKAILLGKDSLMAMTFTIGPDPDIVIELG